MGIFDKKFKKKVKPFSQGYYTVQYANYRFIPNWLNLKSFTSGAESWDTRIFTKPQAEIFVEGLNNIDDVRVLYKTDNSRESDSLDLRNEDRKVNVSL